MNLDHLLRQATSSDLKRSNWYVEANFYLNQISCHLDIPMEKICGIVSALSPACPWKQNIIDAYQFIKSNGHYPNCVTYKRQVQKALRILKLSKKSLHKIPDILGGPKTRAFYQVLLDPTGFSIPVVDTHIIKAFLGQPDIPKNDKRVKYYLKPKNITVIAEAIEELAIDHKMNVHSMQAILWSTWKRITDNKVYSNALPNFEYLVSAPKEQRRLSINA